jgi:hypothetical protein
MRNRRIYLGAGIVITIAVFATVIIIAITGRMPIYGVGGPIMTLDTAIVMLGIGLIYIILFTLPTLMVASYQARSRDTLLRKIEEDLYLCGLRENDLAGRLIEFETRNSIRAFIWPTLINLVLLFVLWAVVLVPNGLQGAFDALTQGPSFTFGGDTFFTVDGVAFFHYLVQHESIVAWSFLGAYFYILTILVDRWLRSDLTTGVLWKLNIRIAVALVVGLLLTAAIPTTPKYVAFLVGIVPDTVLKLIGDRAKVLLGLETGQGLWEASQLQRKIDGITFWQSERLAEEGIESVQNLATKEIPSLLINVRFDTPQLLQWIDQALLRFQVGDQRMETFGSAYIRTATDLFDALDGQDLTTLAATLSENTPEGSPDSVSEGRLGVLVSALGTGPNLPYLREYWANTKNPNIRKDKLVELSSFDFGQYKAARLQES